MWTGSAIVTAALFVVAIIAAKVPLHVGLLRVLGSGRGGQHRVADGLFRDAPHHRAQLALVQQHVPQRAAARLCERRCAM